MGKGEKLTEDPHQQANQKYVSVHPTSYSELPQAIFLFESEKTVKSTTNFKTN